MPESSAWPDIRRWGELHNNEDDFDEEDEGHLEAAVVVHNELYVSEGEEDGIHSGWIFWRPDKFRDFGFLQVLKEFHFY